jgi:hypothetical protein
MRPGEIVRSRDMAARDRVDPDIVIEHPNRDKAASKATRATVILLLLASVALIVVVSVGGWEKIAGAKALQVVYVLLYLALAVQVLRWSRGTLPVIAALAIILLIFAAVSASGWYERDKAGFEATSLEPELLGLLCGVLVPVQVLLIAFAMRGFQQAWNVEVEHPREPRGDALAAHA